MIKKIKDWRVIRKLGHGGNGMVYLVTKGRGQFALKTLRDFSRTKSYARFQNEIKALQNIGPIQGIINIIDSYTPTHIGPTNQPYYIMPVASGTFDQFLKGKSHQSLFTGFLKIVAAVIALHQRDFTHRDIKPNNILVVNGEPVLSDFGLVSFPTKSGLSAQDEKIGPVWTIAPEMKRTSSTAEFKKADVYSLAKTLWILVTGKPFGFEGQYIPNSSISIDKFIDLKINTTTHAGTWDYHSIVLLERLLVRATDNDPDIRPSAQEFHDELLYWMQSNEEYYERNPYEWKEALRVIFPHGAPNSCEWTEPQQILHVLRILTNYDSLNHYFFPRGGGSDLTNIDYNEVSDNFIIDDNDILHSHKLIFKCPGNIEWAYFRLVVTPSAPLSGNVYRGEEEYKVDDNFNYIGEINDQNVKGKIINRFLSGSFLIIQKTSQINELDGTYQGHFLDGYSAFHEAVSYEEYDTIMAKLSVGLPIS